MHLLSVHRKGHVDTASGQSIGGRRDALERPDSIHIAAVTRLHVSNNRCVGQRIDEGKAEEIVASVCQMLGRTQVHVSPTKDRTAERLQLQQDSAWCRVHVPPEVVA